MRGKCSIVRLISLSLGGLFLLSSCDGGESLDQRRQAVGNTVKSQLRGYDLGPPFPAGLRDSGLVNGYAEGEWVPFAAVMEGRKLENADALSGQSGDGVYRANIILPTYSPRNDANAISDVAVSGTYGEGEVTPIPEPFDDGWLVEHGYSPYVLGAYSAEGDFDEAPTVLSVGQRSGPTRFGGNVASVSIPIEFALPAGSSRAELLFAVRLAPPDLEPIAPDGQEFPGTAAGSAAGAGSFFPGPGPIFVGYEVGKPTGIATVPIRVERHSCDSSDGCASGESCTVENCEKIEGSAIGNDGQTVSVSGQTVSIDKWTVKGDSPGEFVGFSYTTDGGGVKYRVKTGGEIHYGTGSPWVHPGGTSGPEAPAISHIVFCPDGEDGGGGGECNDPCVDDSNCPTDEICEDGICQDPPPSCEGDEDCEDDVCVGGYCVPECPDACSDPEFCDPSPCQPDDGGDPPCVLDEQCPNGSVCEDGICQPPGEPCDMSCPDGETCDGGVCQPPEQPCDDDLDCPGGEVCEAGVCEPGTPPCLGEDCQPCDFDSECPGGEACESGTCVPLGPPEPCADDPDCPIGQTCESGYCTPPDEPCGPEGECGPGELCETDTGTCVDAYPPIPCNDELDCPTGDLCIGGYCTPDGDGDPCQNDSDCQGDDVCGEDLVCVPPDYEGCTADQDCASADICIGGYCLPEGGGGNCQNDNHCTGDDVCGQDKVCVPPDYDGCTKDDECPSGDACIGGFCIPDGGAGECTSDSQCSSDAVCIGGYCLPEGGGGSCQNDSDCQGDDVCGEDLVCVPPGYDGCIKDQECASGDICIGGFCIPDGGGGSCTSDSHCASGELCDGGYCVTGHDPVPCTTADECPAGNDDVYLPTCEGGFCRPPDSCAADAECPGGYVCEDGLCEPGQPPTPCETASDCPPGDDDVYVPTCVGGFCTPSSGECADDADCPGGEVCVEGACLPAGDATPCTTQLDCGGGELCSGGFCEPGDGVIECETGNDCPPDPDDDVGAACVGGVCSTSRTSLRSCANASDCSLGYGCTDGVCQPISGACEIDSDCGDGSCIAGWCGTACAAASDCATGDVCALGRCASACSDYSECGTYEICLAGGCQPRAVGSESGQGDPWDVGVPGAGDQDLGSGCSASGDAGGAGAALLLALVLFPLGLSRRGPRGPRVSCGIILLALIMVPGCSFGGSGTGQGGEGGPDASAGESGGGGGGAADGDGGVSSDDPQSPYLLVTCQAGTETSYSEHGEEEEEEEESPDGGVADAGVPEDAAPEEEPESEPDAGVDEEEEQEDAIGTPCCDPNGMCPGDLACIEGPAGERSCQPPCDAETGTCASGGVCANFGDQAVCIPASTEGADCAPELCDDATVCVGESADTATCHRRCEDADDCDEDQTCAPIIGSDSKACL